MDRRFGPSAALSILLLSIPGGVRAQRTATGSAASSSSRASAARVRPSPVAPSKSAGPVSKRPASGVRRRTSNGVFNATDSIGVAFGNSGIQDQDLGIKALIDPATEWRLFEAHKFRHHNDGFASAFYLLDGGYYGPPADSGEVDQSSQPPDQQAPQGQESQEESSQPEESYAQSEPEGSATPLPDAGQFVLVLRNGTQIQAVAFTRTNDRIVYITTDGLRLTLAMADLDSDSTLRLNQERGTPLQVPL